MASIYEGDGFGGGTSMRAVVRELVDEVRALRRELAARGAEPFPDEPGEPGR